MMRSRRLAGAAVLLAGLCLGLAGCTYGGAGYGGGDRGGRHQRRVDKITKIELDLGATLGGSSKK